MCRSWFYKAVNPPLRKADRLSLAIGDVLCGYLLSIAISWAKNEFKFLCELGWFSQRQSHILIYIDDVPQSAKRVNVIEQAMKSFKENGIWELRS